MPPRRPLRLLPVLLLALAASAGAAADEAALPQRLSATGLYDSAPGAAAADRLGAGVWGYEPQYPLWSDGAAKRRWVKLPAGTAIDGSDPDAWRFPVGTRLWKEFAHGGRRVETRYIERRRAGWVYASYVWKEDGSDATLVPEAGLRRLPVAEAPGGRYDLPSRSDCLACHGGAATPVLGLGALQLSSHRDAGGDAARTSESVAGAAIAEAASSAAVAAGRVDSRELARRGLLRGLPAAAYAARIAAPTATARAALGTLHANCGHCHHGGPDAAPVPLRLAQRVGAGGNSDAVRATVFDAPARLRSAALPGVDRVAIAGRPDASLLALRMRSRHAALQMPPLGTVLPDARGIALVERWIAEEPAPAAVLASRQDPQPNDQERPR